MSKMDDEIEFLDAALWGITWGLVILPFFVAVLVFGFRFMERGICERYEGNAYSMWSGKCEWPPLVSTP